MELKKSTHIRHVWQTWLSPIVISLLALQVSASYAQGIRKIVDDKGVTFFTNEPPENDPQSKAVTPVPVANVSTASGASTTSPAGPVTNTSKPPQIPATEPARLPINPAQALGDWPPKSFKSLPATAVPN